MRRRILAVFGLLISGCSSLQTLTDPIPPTQAEQTRQPAAIEPIVAKPERLMWPVSVRKVSRHFKPGGRRPHDGVDISAPKGAKIFAPAPGKVVYAGRKFSGYGKMVIIEHAGKLATIYGHLQKLLVRTGDIVRMGSLIGHVGKTGNATGYHLHFEVRQHYKPIDPMSLLP